MSNNTIFSEFLCSSGFSGSYIWCHPFRRTLFPGLLQVRLCSLTFFSPSWGLASHFPFPHLFLCSAAVALQTTGTVVVIWLAHCSDCARHFSNRCDIYEVAKVVQGNQSDNHYNWSDTWSSILLPELC